MSYQHDAPPPADAEPTPLPVPPGGGAVADPGNSSSSTTNKPADSSSSSATSASPASFDLPKLRLQFHDLGHPGSNIFLNAVGAPAQVFSTAVQNVLSHLYRKSSPSPSPSPATQTHQLHPPPTRSVTLILRSMGGVAYTTGLDLDDDHKEIHLSLEYVANINPAARRAHEITGVLTHELVHCHQWNGQGAAPGGLIEGIADWVRLQCGLAPPHWEKGHRAAKWDAGYQHTAYFLEYLEGRFGEGTVRRLNEKLRVEKYEEKAFWTGTLGRPVEQLWKDYTKTLEITGDDDTDPQDGKTAVSEATQT
ncbi:peptidase of plants and bacteria-domain-containing protein [Apiospora arundinis]|uniref:Peptidase of plants and bacteria-domain-containing protein n=1 Tax=Apiospora arundinis TaxID=335852 RepID=A0ABR2ITH3_9PEZI